MEPHLENINIFNIILKFTNNIIEPYAFAHISTVLTMNFLMFKYLIKCKKAVDLYFYVTESLNGI